MSKHGLTRRRFLAAGASAVAAPALAAPDLGVLTGAAVAPASGAPRAVVVGGGWSGLAIARNLAAASPAFDVVLIEKNQSFHSYPLSNLWLADAVDLEFLTHSYLDAARSHGYRLLSATVVDIDRERRRVYTTVGHVDYDFLVLAPGIDYDFERMGIEDPEIANMVAQRFPGGFVSMSEIISIKRKLAAFEGGVFALTVPNDNYRCMAAPYERACMIGSIFRRRGLAAKVLVLDMNADITVKRDGFTRAFTELYPDIIEYHASAEISGVDPVGKRVETVFDEYPFDDAIIYPKIRASRFLETLGLVDPASPQRSAKSDPFTSQLVDDDRVYLTGDARSQAFSKSGNTAHTEAQYIARLIAARARGEEIPWEGPTTMCFSAVRTDPLEAMSLIANYRFNEETGSFGFDKVHVIENWSEQIATAGKVWAESMYREMFYA